MRLLVFRSQRTTHSHLDVKLSATVHHDLGIHHLSRDNILVKTLFFLRVNLWVGLGRRR
jgi:hypothetical protein